MLNSDAGSDPDLSAFKGCSYGPAILTLSGGLLNLKQEMAAIRDNVKTMCHCSCICRDFAHAF